MSRYYIVIVADNIYLERGTDIPITGFVAPRLIRAQTEDDAIQYIKIQLLQYWKLNFNRDNKAGTPKMAIHEIQRIRNPFKRLKHKEEFYFFGVEEEKQAAVDKAVRAFKRWFIIR